jgi:hypothetical protein
MDLKNINMAALGQLASPRAMNDLNDFIERMPEKAGKTILIAAGIAWMMVAVLGLFTTIQAQDLNNLRAQLQDAKALKPIVPTITEIAVPDPEIRDFMKKIETAYRPLELKAEAGGVSISGPQTSMFSAFREAASQIQNGGNGWKVGVTKLCVGRECPQKQLFINLKINKINIDKPESTPTTYLPGSAPAKDGEQSE